ncbi:glycosyltransferase family 4 protein [Hydrogenobacter sp. T-2]|uniref:glycosyltransferase family 4 protein n=1 Tax=Pampinifervens diazotrophicum TaxID=1632018 RepID=UPI002B25DEED|nr:glycosyltransferase family 4 protein [Hydrogenobacter sp. T-2]WPM31724.1 glycosyltransferase family 4 protein [Hydrogenobacter sp. T-2]
MAKKSIVLASNTSFSLYNFRLGLMRRLKELGYDVVCIAQVDDYTEYLKEEFSFYPLKNLDRKGKNPIKDFKLFLEFLSLYRKIRPDLVINYTIKPNIYSSIASGILGIPSISVITGLGYVFLRGGLLEKLVRVLYKKAFKFNKFIIVQNSEDYRVVKHISDNAKKVILIESSGVNTDYFSPAICEKHDRNKGKTIFLFIGRFLKDKGIIELIEAGKLLWQERKDFEIWLVGGIDYGNPQSLREEDINNIKKYEFVKVLPFSKDVRPLICQADCVVLPSYYKEGIPRSLLEAMSMAKPIITTTSPGCMDVCEDGVNGFLVEQRSISSLKVSMERFLNLSEEDRQRMGVLGRELAIRRFDEKIIIEKYLSLIGSILQP